MVSRCWPCFVGVASVVGFALVGCESEGGSNGTVTPCAIDTAADAVAEISVSLAGSGQCTAGISALVTVENRTEGECSSDILGTIQPGNHRMWFASESGYGGAPVCPVDGR